VYATLQHGVLARYDRKSGEALLIQPQEGKGEPPLRWNWDSPLLISPHAPTRVYFAANRLFRSDDRGNSWQPVSPDLTRQIDRNTLKVMGRVWGPDAIAKSQSTSLYGNIVSLDESRLAEGLLYVGTDDGLVQVSEDGGKTWRREEKFPAVPDMTYVSDLAASVHDANVVYAAFNNHKDGRLQAVPAQEQRPRAHLDLDRRQPARARQHVDRAGGPGRSRPAVCRNGVRLVLLEGRRRHVDAAQGGLPTIAVRDLAIQKRENDLVVATFGRGFYILDDYTPLRVAQPRDLEQPAVTFPVKKVFGYMPSSPIGGRGKGSMGEAFFAAPTRRSGPCSPTT